MKRLLLVVVLAFTCAVSHANKPSLSLVLSQNFIKGLTMSQYSVPLQIQQLYQGLNMGIDGTLLGVLDVELEPSPHSAKFRAVLRSDLNARATARGWAKPSIYISLGADFNNHTAVTKDIEIQSRGVVAGPSHWKSNTQLSYRWVSTDATGLPILKGIKRKFAAKLVYKSRHQIAQEISKQMGVLVSQEFSSKVGHLTTGLTQSLEQTYLKSLLGSEDVLGQWGYETTRSQISIHGGFSDEIGGVPLLEDADLGYTIHASAVEKLAQAYTFKTPLTPAQLQERLPFKGLPSGELEVEPNDALRLLLADSPYHIEFDGNLIGLTVRVKQFVVGERILPGGALVAQYFPEFSAKGAFVLNRIKKVELNDFAGSNQELTELKKYLNQLDVLFSQQKILFDVGYPLFGGKVKLSPPTTAMGWLVVKGVLK